MTLWTPLAHLFVDGYNMIGAWSELQQMRDRHGLDAARQQLVESLINYSALQDYETVIVFDAHLQRDPEYREPLTRHLSAHYTNFAETADTYIEKACASQARQLRYTQKRLIVATSDRAQQQTVTGYGAECVSAKQLGRLVRQAKLKSRPKQRPRQKSSGRFLFNALDAQAQQRLTQMRFGMK
ncbi:NYN domain-containing protein [Spirulina sp. CS-785/01]|uniref:NYN domain-containing protein n=1 Tax=Spirulina sp. CS-785/01 TaxID=3021716 RepID=UPI00232AF4A2|nr:NYN domain-containing protein [Spirulina sp. CS-785/01]MDB9311555.1 NYN domain-containing protein [Spirulina sp. CS-785/01]